MSGWLERLKKLEMPETALTELTKAPSVSFVSAESGGLEVFAPPSVSFVSAVSAPAEVFTLPDPTAAPVDNLEPTTHCPACGSPSWWRAPGAGWRCSYCEPRPQPLPAGAECVTLFSGQWAPGCAPPAPVPVTVDGLLAIHGETVAGCRTLDVLELADDTDLPELRDRVLLEGFAAALVADHQVRPLPDPALPPLERLAQEIGDDPAELRAWLDQSAVGRRCRQRIEREPLAIDRCLIALRDDPDGPLLLALARALAGDRTAEPAPDRPADGHVRNPFGAWRTVEAHAAVAAYDAHHWRCTICQRAGQGYGDRCPTGAALHAATRAHT